MTTQVIEVRVPGPQGRPGPVEFGWAAYNDAATAVTPITLTPNVPAQITNDAQGPRTTREFLPDQVTDVWDASTNQFDFSQLSVGDVVHLRFVATLTSSTAFQTFRVTFVGGIGGSEYSLVIASGNIKTSGTVEDLTRYNSIQIEDDNTRLNPAELRVVSDDDADVTIAGFTCEIFRR